MIEALPGASRNRALAFGQNYDRPQAARKAILNHALNATSTTGTHVTINVILLLLYYDVMLYLTTYVTM